MAAWDGLSRWRMYDVGRNTMTPTIRIAMPEDIPCIVESLKGFASLLRSHLAPKDELGRGVLRLMDDPDTDLLVAVGDSGPCAGFLQQRYRYSLWLSAEEATIEDLFVPATERRAGVGRALMDAALARAIERGCKRASLDVIETNDTALRMYEGMGFSCVRSRSIFEADTVTTGRQLFMVKELGSGRCHTG